MHGLFVGCSKPPGFLAMAPRVAKIRDTRRRLRCPRSGNKLNVPAVFLLFGASCVTRRSIDSFRHTIEPLLRSGGNSFKWWSSNLRRFMHAVRVNRREQTYYLPYCIIHIHPRQCSADHANGDGDLQRKVDARSHFISFSLPWLHDCGDFVVAACCPHIIRLAGLLFGSGLCGDWLHIAWRVH